MNYACNAPQGPQGLVYPIELNEIIQRNIVLVQPPDGSSLSLSTRELPSELSVVNLPESRLPFGGRSEWPRMKFIPRGLLWR